GAVPGDKKTCHCVGARAALNPGRSRCGLAMARTLAADELRVGFNNKPAAGHRMPRRPWSDRSREGGARLVPRRRSCSIATNRLYRIAIPQTKGALLGKSAL